MEPPSFVPHNINFLYEPWLIFSLLFRSLPPPHPYYLDNWWPVLPLPPALHIERGSPEAPFGEEMINLILILLLTRQSWNYLQLVYEVLFPVLEYWWSVLSLPTGLHIEKGMPVGYFWERNGHLMLVLLLTIFRQ